MPPKIPAQVFVFGLAVLPPAIYAAYYNKYGETNDEIETKLRQKYAKDIEYSAAKNKGVTNVLKTAVYGGSSKIENKIDHVFKAGKDARASNTQVLDKKLYYKDNKIEDDDEEEEEIKDDVKNKSEGEDKVGQKLQQEQDEQMEKITRLIGGKKKRKKKKKKRVKQEEKRGVVQGKEIDSQSMKELTKDNNSLQTLVTITSVAAVAAIVGFVLGGSNSRR